MTRDDIIRMAREAECSETWGGDAFKFTVDELERFAALVAEAERNACAAIANEHAEDCYNGDQDWYKCRSIEKAIRARGNK
jgi:hypothetical protein